MMVLLADQRSTAWANRAFQSAISRCATGPRCRISQRAVARALARPLSARRLDCFVAGLLAMLISSPGPPFSARSEACEDKVDHLVDRRSRFVGGLRDHLRMEKPDHRGAGALRRERHIRGLEFTRRDALGDDADDA